MNDIEAFIDEIEVNMLEYFDAVVRNTVESVLIISQNKIKIKYIGGIETIREMNSNIATIYKQNKNIVPNA